MILFIYVEKEMEVGNFILRMGIYIEADGKVAVLMEKEFMKQKIGSILPIGDLVYLQN